MTIEISTSPNQNGSLFVTVTFTDQNGDVIPISSLTSANWSLKKTDGTIVNAGGALTDDPVLLQGDDLAIDSFDNTDRLFCVVIIYDTTVDSVSYSDVDATEEAKFSIVDLGCQ